MPKTRKQRVAKRQDRRDNRSGAGTAAKAGKKVVQSAGKKLQHALNNAAVFSGSSPLPDGKFENSKTFMTTQEYIVAAGSGTSEVGVLILPSPDKQLIKTHAANWTGNGWTVAVDNDANASMESLYRRQRATCMSVSIKSLLPADVAPATLRVGHVGADVLTSDMATVTLGSAVETVHGKPLESTVLGTGDQKAVMWKPHNDADYERQPSTNTTTLGDSYASGDPKSKLLLIFDGTATSTEIALLRITTCWEADVVQAFASHLPMMKHVQNPQMAALLKEIYSRLNAFYPDLNIAEVDHLMAELAKETAKKVVQYGLDHPEEIIEALARVKTLAKLFL